MVEPESLIPAQPEWLKKRTIFLTRHGSHAYGTSTPTSDLDVKGIAIPPMAYWLGFSRVFEQAISHAPADLTIYGLRKFMNLAADCNPAIIEVLWVDDSDVLISSWAGDILRENKHLFISQKAKHTFSGYAISQLKRIKTHRRWLMNPPTCEPTRAVFGLPERKLMKTDDLGAAEAEVRKIVDGWELDLSGTDDALRIHIMEQLTRVINERTTTPAERQAAALIGFDTNMIEYIDKERRFNGAVREWQQYNQWKTERNEVRAALEAKFGYDTKHAMHLVRLLRMCREILEGKGVIVKRPDAEELLSIRNGAWEYDQLVEFAEREDQALVPIMKASSLPRAPDRDALDELCADLADRSFWHE